MSYTGSSCFETARVAEGAIEAIPTAAYPLPARRPLNSRLDTTKLRTAFALSLPPWQAGVDRVVDELTARSLE